MTAKITPPIRHILEASAKFFLCTTQDMMGASRKRVITDARRYAALIMKHTLALSYQDIADILDKDVSSIFESVGKLEDLRESDRLVQEAIEQIWLEALAIGVRERRGNDAS